MAALALTFFALAGLFGPAPGPCRAQSPPPVPPPAPGLRAVEALEAAFFSSPTCLSCADIQALLQRVAAAHPRLNVVRYNIASRPDQELRETFDQAYAVREEYRGAVPAVFLGRLALLGDEITAERVEAEAAAFEASGRAWVPAAAPFPLPAPGATGAAPGAPPSAGIAQRFSRFGALGVMAAGLVDGFNPCALTILSLYISYLYLAARRGVRLLALGAAFTAGVFATYFAAGLGLFRLLALVPPSAWPARVLYAVAVVFCGTLGGLSVVDFFRLRRRAGGVGAGRGSSGAILHLPGRLKELARSAVRRRARAGGVAGAFLIGAATSVLAFACSGQMYIPTLVYISGVPGLRARAAFYLLLYNLMFCLPMIAIFAAAALGTGSQRLAGWLEGRAPAARLAAGVVFLGLAAFFAARLLGAWG